MSPCRQQGPEEEGPETLPQNSGEQVSNSSGTLSGSPYPASPRQSFPARGLGCAEGTWLFLRTGIKAAPLAGRDL